MDKVQLIAAIKTQQVRASTVEQIQERQVGKIIPGFSFKELPDYDVETLKKVHETLQKIQGKPLF